MRRLRADAVYTGWCPTCGGQSAAPRLDGDIGFRCLGCGGEAVNVRAHPVAVPVEGVPEVLVMGRATAVRYEPGEREVCLSISTPGEAPADLSPRFRDILRLIFGDYTGDDVARLRRESIQPGDAERITTFVAKHQDARRIVVHCTAGVSRSPSVARAIVHYGLPQPNGGVRLFTIDNQRKPGPDTAPNRHVFRTVANALARRFR